MTTVAYKSTELAAIAGSFVGGLRGAPSSGRSSFKDKATPVSFHFTQGANQGNIGDTVDLAYVKPTAVFYGGVILWTTGTTSQVETIVVTDNVGNAIQPYGNPNAPANYAGPQLVLYPAAAAVTAGYASMQPAPPTAAGYVALPFQVGVDPAGDQSAGDTPLGYGSSLLTLLLTNSGAGRAAGQIISGYFLLSEGN